jgi:hypothetical protein
MITTEASRLLKFIRSFQTVTGHLQAPGGLAVEPLELGSKASLE